ncbi:MAG: adenosylcobinamide-GDP ribazoletransferase [Candidatus Omnitrophica bacterium]|nr:adenosylcobinamide-GDP ribazoletransferase [Candidatus Omnitrophota bacterium]
MSSFLLAIQFLTILPLGEKKFSPEKLAWALIYFPIVGLFLGAILAGLNICLSSLGISALAVNIILVIALVILTRGIHLDGLADTTDAFLSGKGKEETLEIMRDPHIGVMGALSLISILILKIGLLSSVSAAVKPAALMLMCISGRWSAVLSIYLFPYARQEGKAKVFIEGMSLKIFIISAIIVIICAAIVLNIAGLVVLLIVSGCAYIIGRFICSKIEGVTGDTLGAVIELTEVITLLIICIGQGVVNG